MGFRTRRSFTVIPGVRMTVSKSGISTSVGIKGARMTRTASGRVTRTLGIPGTGISHTSTLRQSAGSASRRPASTTPAPAPATAHPGLLSPKWEKALYAAIFRGQYGDLPTIARTHPEARLVAATIDGLTLAQTGNDARALEVLRFAWSLGGSIETHPFVLRYLQSTQITLEVATGVTATLPLCRYAVGLALAELEQGAGGISTAIQLVEQLEPTVLAAVSLCELYLETHAYEEVLSVTETIHNSDDPTALLVAYRGAAFHGMGLTVAARECFKEALKSKARDPGIRQLALIERAKCYLTEDKPSMAKKDLERVLAENATHSEALALLHTL